MRFAYADPPYLGLAKYYTRERPEAAMWDDPEAHRALIERLVLEYPDGWALSLHTPSLKTLLPMVPAQHRIGAWVKPWCSWKPSQRVAFAWEPVIFVGGREMTREVQADLAGRAARGETSKSTRDWIDANMEMEKGLTGAKPQRFSWWLFEFLGALPGDTLDDLFPGTGQVGRAFDEYIDYRRHQSASLFTAEVQHG